MVAPKLRFDGFDSDWTLDSIGAVISNKSKKYDPEKSEIDFPCIELEHLSQQTGEILGTVSAKDQKSIKNVFDENSVLFGKLRPYLRKFAKPEFQGVCSSEIWVLTSKKMQPNFLFQYVQTDGFSELTQIQAGSKMPRADWGSISNGEILFPIFEEQTKIASFLSAVDEKISQLSQKHQLLSQYKQGMMQKLFSQQIRFKADDGSEFEEWEITTLGLTGKFIGGGTPSKKVTEFWQGSIPWISSSDLVDESIFNINITRFISTEALNQSATKLIPANSILIVSRVGVGKVAVTDKDICTSQDFTNLVLNNGNTVFFGYLIKSLTGRLLEMNQGTSIKGFVKDDLSTLKVQIPCLEEQLKIANLLSSIDQKIDIVLGQLEQAKQWKKGLLQQMFV